MEIATTKAGILTVIGAAGGVIASFFGGWNAGMTTLLIFMGIDYLTGLLVALVFKKSPKTETGGAESRAGWKGLCRKGMTLLIVLIAARLDAMIQTTFIRDGVVIAYCANELLSIVENAGLMGVPIPKQIVEAIEVLKNETGSEEKDNG